MKSKTWVNWLKHSGVWVGVVLNPYHWQFDLKTQKDAPHDEYGVGFLEINLGLIWIRIAIDDGRW